MNSNIEERKFLYKILIALVGVGAAAMITLFVPALDDGGMYFLFLTAIIFSTIYGDWRNGIFAFLLSLVVNFFLLGYLGKLPNNFSNWIVLSAFCLTAGLTIFIYKARMQAETARLLAESRYRMIFEDAITGIYETTVDGKYSVANPKLAEILGFESAAQLIDETENLNEKFYAVNGRRIEFMRLVEKNGQLSGFESEIYRRDGKRIWITENALAVRNKANEIIGFQGTTIEITDRKLAEAALEQSREELEEKVVERTADLESANKILRDEIIERMRVEQALRQSEEKFRALVEVSSELIWEVDEHNYFTYISPKSEEFHGYKPEEIIGQKPFFLMSSDEAKRVAKIFREIVETLDAFYFLETVTVHKDGIISLSESSGVPFFDEAGIFRGYRGVARDITERKRAENELVASQKELRALSAHLQSVREEERIEIARELHDELGQTLTALKIEVVRLEEKSGARNNLSSADFKTKVAVMLSIVDGAMDTTRKIVAQLRPGILDELGLAAALEWQTGEFRKLTKIECNLEIEFEESAAFENLKTTIFRILQECLTNIARHSGAKKVRITLKDEGFRIFFEVQDDGRGISGEETAGNSHSFGILGMRERVLLLNGTVEISRVAADGGTRVTVQIPRPSENAANTKLTTTELI